MVTTTITSSPSSLHASLQRSCQRYDGVPRRDREGLTHVMMPSQEGGRPIMRPHNAPTLCEPDLNCGPTGWLSTCPHTVKSAWASLPAHACRDCNTWCWAPPRPHTVKSAWASLPAHACRDCNTWCWAPPRAISCRAVSCHVVSCRAVSCHVVSRHVVSCLAVCPHPTCDRLTRVSHAPHMRPTCTCASHSTIPHAQPTCAPHMRSPHVHPTCASHMCISHAAPLQRDTISYAAHNGRQRPTSRRVARLISSIEPFAIVMVARLISSIEPFASSPLLVIVARLNQLD